MLRMMTGLIVMAAVAAPLAAAAPKNDIRGISIGMTPAQVRQAFSDCAHKDPSNIWQSVQDASGAWIGRSVMTCRIPGEPASTLSVTFTSVLSGKMACKIEYQFHSARTTDALVADVMAQFGVGKTETQSAVYIWQISSGVNLGLAAYTQQKTLSLTSDRLCDRDKQAVADYKKAQQNGAPAPTF